MKQGAPADKKIDTPELLPGQQLGWLSGFGLCRHIADFYRVTFRRLALNVLINKGDFIFVQIPFWV
jgi:hypothetical protein